MAPASPKTLDVARARHAALVAEINEHDHRYYVLDAPSIEDRDYDRLFRELRALEAEHPELCSPSSPTQRVGAAPRDGFVKVEHTQRMYSLDNAYAEGELNDFDRRIREGLRDDEVVRYVCEPKIDGASLEVIYRGGRLELAATRGDGAVGEDVTANVRTIRGLPLTIADTRELTLRGEVLIHRAELEAVNVKKRAAGDEPFANPRNAAAGSLRLLDPRLSAERPLRVLFYDLVERHFPTHAAMLEGLAEMGLPTHRRQKVCASLAEVLAYIQAFDAERRTLPYDTDGVVIKLDDLGQRDRLGFTARFPRWAIAYKYQAERAQTMVRSIVADVGRTGALTPVAELDPVQLSGTVVSRASLHNADYVRTKDVRVGDAVTIEKAGEIIPQVVEVNLALRPPSATPWEPPSSCPVCGTEAVQTEGEVALRCPNERCPGRLKAALFHFTRRGAMDVDGVGWVLVEQLVDTGLVRDLADLFALPSKRDALVALPRMAEKSADNVIAAVEEARTSRTLERLLVALGIPHVGTVAARAIAQRIGDLRAFVALDAEGARKALADLHGIGPKIADAVVDYIEDEGARLVLRKLVELGVTAEQPPAEAPVEGPLSGRSFCVTGVLSQPREQIHEAIRKAGGEVHDRVKKGTTYLVAGAKVGQTKLDAARKHGAEVIDETKLAELLGAS